VESFCIGDAYEGESVLVGFVGDAKHGAGSCGLLAGGFAFDFGGAVFASGH
jgi:hypothetical protein